MAAVCRPAIAPMVPDAGSEDVEDPFVDEHLLAVGDQRKRAFQAAMQGHRRMTVRLGHRARRKMARDELQRMAAAPPGCRPGSFDRKSRAGPPADRELAAMHGRMVDAWSSSESPPGETKRNRKAAHPVVSLKARSSGRASPTSKIDKLLAAGNWIGPAAGRTKMRRGRKTNSLPRRTSHDLASLLARAGTVSRPPRRRTAHAPR